MKLLEPLIMIPVLDEQVQVILIDPLLRVIIILPDERAVLPRLRKCILRQQILILPPRVQVEDKQPARLQVLMHQHKDREQVPRVCHVVQTVPDRGKRIRRPRKRQLPHILLHIEDPLLHILRQRLTLPLRNRQHVRRQIQRGHLIARRREPLRDTPRAAAELHDAALPQPMLLQEPNQVAAPLIIIPIVHKCVIHLGKTCIGVHRCPP